VTPEPVLSIRGLTVSYGAVTAVENVDLSIAAGQLVGLIGPNGAGKTTLIDAITGFTPCIGNVHIGGVDITSWPPHRRSAAGLARTWQTAQLFDDLTVRENVAVATGRPSIRQVVTEALTGRPLPNQLVDDALRAVRIDALAQTSADRLTEGQRKLVGVARAFAGAPKVVCLDEPAAGLDRTESRELASHLGELVRGGVAMLLVDHDMDLVFSACHHVVVLDFGRVIAQGTPDKVANDPEVVAAYLGGGMSLEKPSSSEPDALDNRRQP
jgi:branched-chain amino acid transport system ATP-binding protein